MNLEELSELRERRDYFRKGMMETSRDIHDLRKISDNPMTDIQRKNFLLGLEGLTKELSAMSNLYHKFDKEVYMAKVES